LNRDNGLSFWGHLGVGFAAGVFSGSLVGFLEAVYLALFGPDLKEFFVFPYGVGLYGLCFLIAGVGLGFCGWIISKLSRREFSRAGSFATYGGILFSVLGIFIAQFRIVRDLRGEQPIPMLGKLLLIICLVVVFLLYRLIFKALARRGVLRWVPGFVGGIIWLVALVVILYGIASAVSGPSYTVGPLPSPEAQESLKDRPNIILIMVDTQRADRLSCYGYEMNQTPQIDGLASEGVLFRRAFAQSSWTRPSTATLITSLYATSHRAVRKPDRLPSAVTTIAEVLNGHGYYTGGFANNANVTPSFNFDQGHSEYHYLAPDFFFFASESGSFLTFYNQLRLVRERFLSQRKYVKYYYQDAEVVTGEAKRFIDKHVAEKFFLFLHYMEPHDPDFVHPYNGEGYARVNRPHPPPEMAGEYSDVYDGEVSYLDRWIGNLVSYLKAKGLYDGCMIVFTSDHGEEFYEHQGWWHGKTLYEEQLHVPLIMKLPEGRFAGRVRDDFVRLLDVAPTILTQCGFPKPDEMQGRNLLSEQEPPQFVFAEEDHEGNILQSVRTDEWKLVLANEGNPRGLEPVELYNLTQDPAETRNLSQEHPEVVNLLRGFIEQTILFAEGKAVEAEQTEIDEATRERLKALGYVE
jgi:arylsulfatase A-like enzyme